MKTYWKMPKELKLIFNQEITDSQNLFNQNEILASWKKLERAHIIGQPWAVEHTFSHWKMLIFAFKIKEIKEIL